MVRRAPSPAASLAPARRTGRTSAPVASSRRLLRVDDRARDVIVHRDSPCRMCCPDVPLASLACQSDFRSYNLISSSISSPVSNNVAQNPTPAVAVSCVDRDLRFSTYPSIPEGRVASAPKSGFRRLPDPNANQTLRLVRAVCVRRAWWAAASEGRLRGRASGHGVRRSAWRRRVRVSPA